MSERPEREWAAAKAMYEKETGQRWASLPPGHPEQIRWLGLAQTAMDAAEAYSWSLQST